MSDIQHLMAGFNDELAKHANSVSTVGIEALKSALSGLKGFNAEKFRVPAAALGMKAVKGMGNAAREGAGVASRFGQRQVHGLTGWTPKGYMNPEGIKGMRAGAHDAAERLSAAERTVAPGAGRYRPGLVDRVLKISPEKQQARAAKAGHKEVVDARKSYQAAQKAEDMGLTSLPGYARALMRNPAAAVSTGMAEQWHSMGPGGKALMLGIPAAGVGSELTTESQPGGPGKFERAGSRLGELAYTMGPVPLSGQIAAGIGVSSLGKRVGSLFDKKKSIPAPPNLEPAGGEAAPAETMVSDRALGLGLGGYQ